MKTKIYFYYGAMNSGKSLELIRVAHNYQEQGHDVIVIKPDIDTRKPGFVYSRTGLKIPCAEVGVGDVNQVATLLKDLYLDQVAILIEEANFFSKEVIDYLVDFCYNNSVRSLMFFGLKVDFRGNLFEGSKRVIERADKIIETTSICFCGKKARQNARVVNGVINKDGPTIMIDDENIKLEYHMLCNYHFHKNQVRNEEE